MIIVHSFQQISTSHPLCALACVRGLFLLYQHGRTHACFTVEQTRAQRTASKNKRQGLDKDVHTCYFYNCVRSMLYYLRFTDKKTESLRDNIKLPWAAHTVRDRVGVYTKEVLYPCSEIQGYSVSRGYIISPRLCSLPEVKLHSYPQHFPLSLLLEEVIY